jgi:oxygen-dependent protoporphyrinogen oxidase
MIAAKRKMAAVKKSGRPSLPMFMSLQGGMQQYVDTIAGTLDAPYTQIRLQTQATSITRESAVGNGYTVHLQNGDVMRADELVITTPANVTSRLVRPLDAIFAENLGQIRFVSTAVVSLGYHKGPGVPKFKGFGFIIPKSEQRRITACTYSSTKFISRAPDDYQMLRCFMGGPGREEILALDDERLAHVAAEEVADIMGIEASPKLTKVYRWMKLNPQYDLGHLDLVTNLREQAAELGNISLAGCSYDGVGVPDCTRQGKETAAQIMERVRAR